MQRGRTDTGTCGVSKTKTISEQRGMVSRVAEMGLSGLRAEKLTNGCDSVVTADPDDHSP